MLYSYCMSVYACVCVTECFDMHTILLSIQFAIYNEMEEILFIVVKNT